MGAAVRRRAAAGWVLVDSFIDQPGNLVAQPARRRDCQAAPAAAGIERALSQPGNDSAQARGTGPESLGSDYPGPGRRPCACGISGGGGAPARPVFAECVSGAVRPGFDAAAGGLGSGHARTGCAGAGHAWGGGVGTRCECDPAGGFRPTRPQRSAAAPVARAACRGAERAAGTCCRDAGPSGVHWGDFRRTSAWSDGGPSGASGHGCARCARGQCHPSSTAGGPCCARASGFPR
jgi:hypothetical protein